MSTDFHGSLFDSPNNILACDWIILESPALNINSMPKIECNIYFFNVSIIL